MARWLYRTGIHHALGWLPKRDSLLILNYHRLGDPYSTPYDPGLFSATAEQFEAQVAFVARHLIPVTLKETLGLIEGGGDSHHGCRALITFDDGYLDNFEIAFPILKRFGMQGVFFLPTAFIGTRGIPWWDTIAFLVRSARNRRFTLHYPEDLALDLDAAPLSAVLRRTLALYKRPEMTDSERFITELESACGGRRPNSGGERCFMDWDEVQQMIAGGMAIGGHTHTHRLLGRLPAGEQLQELTECRQALRAKAGITVETMAYPVGSHTSFTSQTKSLAAQAGYRAAFSYYGGINRPDRFDPFDVRRVAVDWSSLERFTMQTTFAALANRYWP